MDDVIGVLLLLSLVRIAFVNDISELWARMLDMNIARVKKDIRYYHKAIASIDFTTFEFPSFVMTLQYHL